MLIESDKGPVRLFCLPWAGGVAGSLVAWSDTLSPVQVAPLELAGRGLRYAEAPMRRWSDPLAMVKRSRRDFRARFVLFGHSMGAVLAYELARQLEHECGIVPAGLIVSGAAAPHCRREMLHSRMRDGELSASLVKAGGTPPEILDDAEFLEHYLSLLKADLCLLESYRWQPGPGVGCPVFAVAGRDDDHASPEAVRSWRAYCEGRFEFRQYPGGHFYFMSQREAFLAEVKRFVVACGAADRECDVA